MKIKFILTFIAFLLANKILFAQQHISVNTTWSSDQILTQSVIVDAGVTLTILEGVRIKTVFIDVDANQIGDIFIQVNGKLVIEGSPCNPVIFEPFESTTNKKYWAGIIINSTLANLVLNHFEVHNAYTGVNLKSKAEINNLKIFDSGLSGVNVEMSDNNSYIKISNLQTFNDSIGVNIYNSENVNINWLHISSCTSTGFKVINSNNIVVSNALIKNCFGSGVYNKNSELKINYTLIKNCSLNGIFNIDADLEVYNSRIKNNLRFGVFNSSSIINMNYCDIDSNSLSGVLIGGLSNTIITNSTIYNNDGTGFELTDWKKDNDLNGVWVKEGAPVISVSNCNIYGHDTYVTDQNTDYSFECMQSSTSTFSTDKEIPIGSLKYISEKHDRTASWSSSTASIVASNLTTLYSTSINYNNCTCLLGSYNSDGSITYNNVCGGTCGINCVLNTSWISDPKTSDKYTLKIIGVPSGSDIFRKAFINYYSVNFEYGGHEIFSTVDNQPIYDFKNNYWGVVVNVGQRIHLYNSSIDYSAYSPVLLNTSHSYFYSNNLDSANFPEFSITTSTNNNYLCGTGSILNLFGPSGSGFTYNWLYNSAPFGVTSQNYSTSTAGIYSVVVNNGSGCIKTSAPISIEQATAFNPIVTTNDNVIGCIGENVNLTSTTSSIMSYQWYKNGNAIIGATNNTYTANSTGNYHIVATDTVSSCTWLSDTISVNLASYPTVSISTVGLPVINCQGETKSIVVTPSTNLNFVWYLNNVLIPNSNTSTYSASQAGSYYVIASNNNGCKDTSNAITISINNYLPTPAGVISGATNTCQGQNSLIYTVPSIANATSYVWTLPSGATGSSTTNSITINYGVTAVSGNISVKGNNTCGDGAASSLAVTVNSLPLAAGTITGSATVCQGQSPVTYTVPAITNATSYTWTLPTGATGSSSTNSITVNYGTTAVTGNVSVRGNNTCGNGIASSLAVTVNPLPQTAGTITGSITVCQGQSSVTYTVPAIANATSYAWTLPTGATGSSSTNSITVNYGATAVSGNISVKGNNACGDGAESFLAVTVNSLPLAAGTITGSATVCQGQNSVTYTVPTISNATSYTWTLPTGATGSSTTNSITVNYDATATSGNVTVMGNNTCGNGSASSIPVTVNPLPVAAGTITGSTTVCQGQSSVTYTVPTISNATSYAWSLPTGAIGSSTTNSITVNYGATAVSGNVTVRGNNTCGNGTASILAVTVNPLPVAAGTITGSATVCQGQNSVTYTVPTISNATSYVWSFPTGATGTSSTNSITVNYSTSAMSGNITVKGNNSCGDGEISSLAITVLQFVDAASTLTGSTIVCQGQNSVTYTVPAIANASSYIWSLPSGATGASSTNSITVNFGLTAVSGNITVKGSNSCGDGATSSLPITVNPIPASASSISGSTTVCQSQSSVTYTVPTIANATSYVWSLPSDVTGASTTNSITVDFGASATSGNITVKGSNSCGEGTSSSLSITVVPAPPANAGNDTTICQGSSMTLIANGGNSYLWSNGVNQGVPFTPLFTDIYTVTVSNGFCSAVDSITVTVSTPPTAPIIYQVGNDLHSTSATGNQWYNDNGLISGASAQIYTPIISGNYYVILSDSFGCTSDTSNVLYVTITKIDNNASNCNNNTKIYPNPVSDELIIEFAGNKEIVNFEILNSIGQVVFIGNLQERTVVQTSNFEAGVYFIKLENGNMFEFKKIVKN